MGYECIIPLKAKIEDKAIKFYWLGKWRPVRHYPYNKVPSVNVIKQSLQTFRLNAGLDKDQPINPVWEV